MSAVMKGSIARKMVPVLWDTGNEVSRHEPYKATDEMMQTLRNVSAGAADSTAVH
jgi:hypothetical protein